MTTCPNCGQAVSETDKLCPKCQFNLQKYRDAFFNDQATEAGKAGSRATSRQAYRQEFVPKKQNLVVQRMLEWTRANSMIVLLLGVFLLIVMSFSRSIGWIGFFALLVWLYLVCARADKIERYTADERLTERVNQLGSNMFNNVEESSQKAKSRGKTGGRLQQQVTETAVTKKHFGYVQLLVVLLAVINLIVLFAGSGASVSDVTYSGKMSITRVTFSLAGHLFSSSTTLLSGILLCLIWLLLVCIPILIVYHTLRSTRKGQIIAFLLSVIETGFLIYLLLRLSNNSLSNTGFLHRITSELLVYAVSIGASTYFLILSSIMTTALSGYSLISKKK
ncbi:zinc ribbon domain-containing protein [Lactobacillus xylocopicola]|uniref:Zinc ribbon domain-containing protein n=1 Tax=Lactobacillus xylocopicola TaxID=2976676 RepID=A0ABN6SI64_9LACO|nr:zinc ribbon domain-containing protein [Lactobacillus xylocopicola]BDR60008.1 zinc ribbon domain-containing protein [Lactobacillus xylocopicola]